MLREIVLYPANDAANFNLHVDPNGSIYGGSNQITLWQAWKRGWTEAHTSSNTPPANDVCGWVSYSALQFDHTGYGLVAIDPAPTLALFTKVTIEALVDFGQGHANDWWLPPDNAFGPRAQLWIGSRGGNYSGPVHEWGVDLDYTATNLNFNTGGSYTGPAAISWEMLSHPAGGPFTLSDMNHLTIGVYFSASNGPSGGPADVAKFHRLRALACRARVEIQDLGGYTKAVRHNASASLRLQRRARNTIGYTVPADEQPKDIGEVTHIAQFDQGWRVETQERAHAMIVGRAYWPEDLRVDDETFDLNDFSCEAWAAFMIPISWTPELSGLAYLDQGGDFTMTRAQDAWSLRPGDGAALRALEDYANLSEDGLACHTGGEDSLCLYSQNFTTGWTSTDVTGGLVFAVETGAVTVDELGYQTATRFTFGGTPGTGGKKQTFALTAGNVVSIRARVRNLIVDTPGSKFLEVAFLDNSGNYWDNVGRAWSASPVYIAIAADKGYGEAILNQVPIANTETHTLKIGRFSSAIAQATFVVGLADVFRGSDGCGMPLINLASTSVRVGDKFEMNNAGSYTFLHRARGMVISEWRPFWLATELDDNKVKTIWYAGHASAHYDRLDFIAKDSGADLLRFTREDTGGTQTLDVQILDSGGSPLDLTRDHVIRVWARWLDAKGYRDRSPYEVAVGYAIYDTTGNFLSVHEGNAVFNAPDGTLEDVVRWGTDGTLALDGWIRTFEVKHNLVTGEEATWRR